MISIEKMRRWEMNDNDHSLNMIIVGYDPGKKQQYIKNSGFDIDCEISDNTLFSSIIYEIITSYIGSQFIVKLKNEKFSWLPQWLKQEFTDYYEIEKFLCSVRWKRKKYFGSFQLDDLKEFLSLFIDYPLKYKYQDIELLSVSSNYVVTISHHGTVWIISDKCQLLKEIAKIIDSKDATVFPRSYLE